MRFRVPSLCRQVEPLPERPETLDALKRTDFRRTVLLEDWRDEFADRPRKEPTVPPR